MMGARAAAADPADVTGHAHGLAEAGAKATVWIFISHDCPICNAYAPELNRIVADYRSRGVAFNLVYCESGLAPDDLQAHARARGYSIALFCDPRQRLAKTFGIDVTPEIALVLPDGALAYRGRIDDHFGGPGIERPTTQTHDLRAALEAVLHGDRPPVTRTAAVGCSLEPL